MTNHQKLTTVKTLRKQARQHSERGAVTVGYTADRSEVLKILNAALAMEIIGLLRHRCHHFMVRGLHGKAVATEFMAHSNSQLCRADQLATRIVQLGGEPDFSPEGVVERSGAEYVVENKLHSMIRENLVAERIAIDSYRDMIGYLGDQDHTTSGLLKQMLARSESHANDMAALLHDLPEGVA